MLPVPLSPFALQQARRDAAARFYAIGLACVPPGYSVAFRKSLSGAHYGGDTKRIEAPRPVTRKSLYIFLHECAHAHLHAGGGRKPTHVKEAEAEQWAHDMMRSNGVAVPRAMTERARRYVAQKIERAQKRGAKAIDPKAARFAKGTGRE